MQSHATASARVRLVAPIRAAIYARVSSDQQAERHTIDSQVEALLARAATRSRPSCASSTTATAARV